MARRAGGVWCGCALALAVSAMLLGAAAAFERDASAAAAGEARVRLADTPGGAANVAAGTRKPGKMSGGGGAAALVFAEALRQLLERHLLGVCDTPPATVYSKYEGVRRGGGAGAAGNSSGGAGVGAGGCAAEDPRELSSRLAELALRASMLSRSRACDSLLSVSLAHALGDLARKSSRASPSLFRAKAGSGGAAGGGAGAGVGATGEKKPRKLSKSQKTKLQAKQKTALAVKKKAAAAAAAALLNNKLRSELPA